MISLGVVNTTPDKFYFKYNLNHNTKLFQNMLMQIFYYTTDPLRENFGI